MSMTKSVIILSHEELMKLIHDSVKSILCESDVCNNAQTCLSSNLETQHNENDNTSHLVEEFVGKTFMFYLINNMGIPEQILFSFNKIMKWDSTKVILKGSVIVHSTQINDDKIVIDYKKNIVKYHESSNRTTYPLEIDNRFKPLWIEFLNCLMNEINYNGKEGTSDK